MWLRAGALVGLVTILTLAFQNCGQGFSSKSGDSTFLNSDAGGSLPGDPQIIVDPNAALSVFAEDVAVVQNGQIQAVVRLNKVDTDAVVVNFSTVNASATAGTHFTTINGSVNIPAGQLSVQVPISILKSETTAVVFGFRINSASKGTIGRATSNLTIPASSIQAKLFSAFTLISTLNAPTIPAPDPLAGIRYYHVPSQTLAGQNLILFGGPIVREVMPPNQNTLSRTYDYTFLGAIFDIKANAWRPMNTVGAPTPRGSQSAVWTGTEFIVFGGNVSPATYLNSGGIFNPATNSWRPLSQINAPSARGDHAAGWVSNQMMIWGGTNGSTRFRDGALFNPQTNQWTPVQPPLGLGNRHTFQTMFYGDKFLIFSGFESTVSNGTTTNTAHDDGFIFNLTTGQWTQMSASGVPKIESSVGTRPWGSASGGRYYFAFGGYSFQPEYLPLNDGYLFDIETNTWKATSKINAPSPRAFPRVVQAGGKFLVYGGVRYSPNVTYTDAFLYDPATDSWSPINVPPGQTSLSGSIWLDNILVSTIISNTGAGLLFY